MKGFLIAGSASGVGKTTATLALIAAMRQRGLVVQPFKGGPDFLDTGHHGQVAGRAARNLDTWMLSIAANEEVLRDASQGADAVVVEGMMGLFDGKDGATERGSSAEIAKLFKLPVVLVLDAAKSARSISATVLGFELFDSELQLAGVILNRVASERHFTMLQTAIRSRCRTPVLGWLPREPLVAIPERHLGLRTAEESSGADIVTLATLAEAHLDLEALLSLECGFDFTRHSSAAGTATQPIIRIGVARDLAFSFYYEDNLDLLRRHGAEIVPFSPTHDTALPDNLHALYLGGGYPELHAERLSANESMLHCMRAFADSDRPIYAECGGMIYLSRQLITLDGTQYAMAGVLPFTMQMTGKLARFGYVTVELTRDCLLGMQGTVVRGHSFHYSQMVGTPTTPTSYRATYSLSGQEEDEGFSVGNVLASYVHLHFRAAPHIAEHFIAAALSVKRRELASA